MKSRSTVNARRPRRQRNSNRSSSIMMQTVAYPMPSITRTKVKYFRSIPEDQFTGLGADSSYAQFTGNSVFNPDLTLALENYPIGVPEWAGLYLRYMVRACQIRVTAQCRDSNLTSNARWLVYPHPYTTNLPAGSTSVDDFIGQPLASPVQAVGPVQGLSHSLTPFTRKLTTAMMLARPESQILRGQDTSGYCNFAGYQPNSQWFWTIICSNDTGLLTRPVGMRFHVELIYDVDFYQFRGQNPVAHSTVGAFVPHVPEPTICPCPPPLALEASGEPSLSNLTALPDPPLLTRQNAVAFPCGCHGHDEKKE